ncbi:MAG: toll/interleukin-1 receptor domain-containing protein [Ruminiclostridium sp.]
MSGVTKKIYERDIIEICKMWNKQLKTIERILPQYYSKEDIIALLKQFYPHEWNSVQFKYEYYTIKDKHLKRIKGRTRYNMEMPEKLIEQSQVFKRISSSISKKAYSHSFNQADVDQEYQQLWRKRKPKIDRVYAKIEKAKLKTQQVTPDFLDQLIGIYERKNTTQKDRMYILLELKKYYNPKIINFFFKLNDTEINKQLREIAFYHLQSFNYQPRLRKQKYMQVRTQNKKKKEYLKKDYAFQRYEIPLNPDELDYRINNSLEQSIKSYDFFISHSSKDSKLVQNLILHLNSEGKNVYCDWISDSDYLKRNLVREATLKVIEKRLEQSKAILFVHSQNSTESVWCKYELNFFAETNKPIYQIDISDIKNGNYDITTMISKWYFDKDYKVLALLN